MQKFDKGGKEADNFQNPEVTQGGSKGLHWQSRVNTLRRGWGGGEEGGGGGGEAPRQINEFWIFYN